MTDPVSNPGNQNSQLEFCVF